MEPVVVKFEWYNELLKKLEDIFPDSQKLSGELRCALEGKLKNIHGFICVVDSWPEFTTVIWKPDTTNNRLVFIKNHHAIVTKNKEQLKKMLLTPGIINWKSCCRFSAIHKRLHEVMKEAAEENGKILTVGNRENVWSITLDTLKTMSVPDGFYLKSLTKDDVNIVVKNWICCEDGVLEYTAALIENFSSVALYNQGQQLVGYMLETNYGTIGFLHVLERFRGQGYSKVIVTSLAKKLLENGRHVHCYIYSNNTVSRNLHKSLGFEEHPEIYSWLAVTEPYETSIS